MKLYQTFTKYVSNMMKQRSLGLLCPSSLLRPHCRGVFLELKVENTMLQYVAMTTQLTHGPWIKMILMILVPHPEILEFATSATHLHFGQLLHAGPCQICEMACPMVGIAKTWMDDNGCLVVAKGGYISVDGAENFTTHLLTSSFLVQHMAIGFSWQTSDCRAWF